MLSSDPTLFSAGLVTGFFGPRTEQALMKFQKKFRINATGFFGPMSRGWFKDNCGKADTDHDGIPNSEDADDDNDGPPDASDSHPHNPNVATSTKLKIDDRDERGKRNADDRKGNGRSDDDD